MIESIRSRVNDTNHLQELFRTKQPVVTSTFGGSDYLFRRWWQEISRIELPDSRFVEDYSTNDRFLKNRLILPEEVPFFTLPLLKAIINNDYQKVFFLERGTFPYLWTAQRLMKKMMTPKVQLLPIRAKGMTREAFSCNILTIAGTHVDDRQFLEQTLNAREKDEIWHHLRLLSRHHQKSLLEHIKNRHYSFSELLIRSREDVIRVIADFGIDRRTLIANILKAVVFQTFNRFPDTTITPKEFYKNIDDSLLGLAPKATEQVQKMIEFTMKTDEKLSFVPMLDWMNQFVRYLRGSLTHVVRPILNILLKDTNTAKTYFNSDKTLFIDEISVCGSGCIALELIGKAFNPRCKFDFGAVVGMWKNECLLNVVSANFFKFKPMEDLPFLSPYYFVPIFDKDSFETVKPHRFPSCLTVSWQLKRWERREFSNRYMPMEGIEFLSKKEADDAQHAEEKVIHTIENVIDWNSFPIIQRRYLYKKEVLSTLVNYYLANFEWKYGKLFFYREPISEAGLEFILDFTGRFQKSFYKEMDRFFTWLKEWERNHHEQFLMIRENYWRYENYWKYCIFQNVINERKECQFQMAKGLEAIEIRWDDVKSFLFTEYDSINTVTAFDKLFPKLQRALT